MLIIEDGTALSNSESYATVAELVAFAEGRGIVIPATTPEQEALLMKAMDYLDSLSFAGDRLTGTQALSWPRSNVYSDGWPLDPSIIPLRLKRAQIQLAIDAMTIDLLPTVVASTKGAVIEETVEGAVSVKYAPPTASVGAEGGVVVTATGSVLSQAAALLRPLLRSMGQLRVGRG